MTTLSERFLFLVSALKGSVNDPGIAAAVDTCFPGDLQIVFDVANALQANQLHPATVQLQLLRATALAEKIYDNLGKNLCQNAVSASSKRSQQKALAEMRRQPLSEQVQAAQRSFEDAHASVASLVCQKGAALKVGVRGPRSASPSAEGPLKRRRQINASDSGESEPEDGEVLEGSDAENADDQEGLDENEYDLNDGWLVDDEEDGNEEEELRALHNMPDFNDPEVNRLRAENAQKALARQEKEMAAYQEELATTQDVERRKFLVDRINVLQEDGIDVQKKIIARASGGSQVVAPPAPAAAPTVIVPRRVVPTLVPVAATPSNPNFVPVKKTGPVQLAFPAYGPLPTPGQQHIAPPAAAPAAPRSIAPTLVSPAAPRRIVPTLVSPLPGSPGVPAERRIIPTPVVLQTKSAPVPPNGADKENKAKMTREDWQAWAKKMRAGTRPPLSVQSDEKKTREDWQAWAKKIRAGTRPPLSVPNDKKKNKRVLDDDDIIVPTTKARSKTPPVLPQANPQRRQSGAGKPAPKKKNKRVLNDDDIPSVKRAKSPAPKRAKTPPPHKAKSPEIIFVPDTIVISSD